MSLEKNTPSALDETITTIRQYQQIYQQLSRPIASSEFSASIRRIMEEANLINATKSQHNFTSAKDTYFSELVSAAKEFQKIFSQCSAFVSQFSSFISEMEKDLEWISELTLSIGQTFNSLQNDKKCEIIQTLSSICENNFCEDTSAKDFKLSEEDKIILTDEIPNVILNDNTSEVTSFGKRHPRLVSVIIYILLNLIFQPFWEYVIAEPAMSLLFRESPASTSNVVYQITQEQNIYIIDEVPYYYYVQTTDPDTNELIEGYISKKSLNPYLNSSHSSEEEK